MVLVYHQHELIRDEIKHKIEEKKQINSRFSISLDEFTSPRNQQYMSINVHEQNSHYNLGMVRMSGTFPAKKCLGILKNHLAEFGLDVETSIVCAVKDGALVMKKKGLIVCIGTSALLCSCLSACSVLCTLFSHNCS